MDLFWGGGQVLACTDALNEMALEKTQRCPHLNSSPDLFSARPFYRGLHNDLI